MHQIFNSVCSTNLSTPAGTYIYDLASQGSSNLAAISSTNSLHVFNAETLQVVTTIPNIHPEGVTCLKAVNSSVLATCGRDGMVKFWDTRNGGKENVKLMSRGKPFLSLAVSESYNAVAAGEELADHTAGVIIWDIRNSTVSRHFTESHNDDVSELQFDPASCSLLLSGSTDGLVNVYDLQQSAKVGVKDATDDDEALFQVINHGSSIHRAAFLRTAASRPQEMDIYALSHDETLTVYALTDPNTLSETTDRNTDEEEEKSVWGDVRQKLECEYAMNLLPNATGGGGTLVVGSHKKQWVELMPFHNDWSGKAEKKRASGWQIDTERGIRLAGGHGEEVARCIYITEERSTVYTGGEDGLIKVWKRGAGVPVSKPEPMTVAVPEEKEEKETKNMVEKIKKKHRKHRAKPY
ncbi:WD40-repeat-containing domain protein [Kalaharituber pfeilii]|nr:WD40-repeat-containing domain protein [Kalaharituber pfeilii]